MSLIWAVALAAQTGAPQLSMDAVNVKQEGVVSFSVLFLGVDSGSEFPEPRFLLGQTEDQAFQLYVDVDSIQQLRFNSFTFTSYLVEAKGATKSYKFQVTGNPTGSFRDTAVKASFHVKSGSNSAAGGIVIPIYNATRADFLQAVETQKEPRYVSVSGVTSLPLALANAPDSLPIAVTQVEVIGGCPKCWRQIASAVNEKNPLNIAAGTNTELRVELTPSSIPALLQGALVIKPEVPHETLKVTATYHTVPGGADKRQSFPVKIRFGPGLFGLAAALLAGIALGLTARYLLTGQLGKDKEKAIHAILSAVVFGLIAEVVGVLMMAYGESKLVLFGLDIDPRQLFPAFVLAILVSGGAAVVAWMKGLFAKGQ